MIEHNDYINASNDRSVAGLLRDIEAGELGTKRQLGLAMSDQKEICSLLPAPMQHNTALIELIMPVPVRSLTDIFLESTA